ncbi:MAG TPA: FkbM family methyltransferase, partial [Phnomibacter sp.]|nr:FkbM family methyltransferase [Phnomibacter sp.]
MHKALRMLHFITRQHPWGRRHPLQACWRLLRWQWHARTSATPKLVPWIGNAKIWLAPGLPAATGNYYLHLYEYHDMQFLLRLLQPGQYFADVGANIGSYTILASAVCQAHSIAIEPVPQSLHWLQRNVEANQIEGLTTLVQAALSHSPGQGYITQHLGAMNHLTPQPGSQSLAVPIHTLDQVLQGRTPTLVKIDVEGAETLVLLGANHTLQQPDLLALIVENAGHSPQQDQPTPHQLLLQHGFATAQYNGFTNSLLPLPGPAHHNTLYVRPWLL